MLALMETTAFEDITFDTVLEVSGVSRGSVYHHFDDYEHLLEEAQLERFSRSVAESIQVIESIMSIGSNREEFLKNLEIVTRATQDPGRASLRYDRARLLATAQHNSRFRTKLQSVQDQLTDSLTKSFAAAQEKGWLNQDFSPRAGAVFIQAHTLGKLVDDITPQSVDPEHLVQFISLTASRAMVTTDD